MPAPLDAAESARANSVVVANRSAGAGASARRKAASTDSGMPGRMTHTDGGGCDSRRAITA